MISSANKRLSTFGNSLALRGLRSASKQASSSPGYQRRVSFIGIMFLHFEKSEIQMSF